MAVLVYVDIVTLAPAVLIGLSGGDVHDGLHQLPAEGKRHFFFEFSLCLSRACLGKIMNFIYKWRKKCRFLAWPPLPSLSERETQTQTQTHDVEGLN